MAITVPTTAPLDLLLQIKSDIAAQQTDEWVWDADGDITLSEAEYRGKAWFRPYVKEGKLVFGIIPATEPKMTPALFAYYHGRLLQTLLERYQNLAGETMTSSLVSKFYDL
ncbi:MAG TPA: hypothetical protein VGN04_13510 [Herbaspirillum sp.]|jgi:hypothetical protein